MDSLPLRNKMSEQRRAMQLQRDKCREVARRVMCYRDGGYYESGMYMSVGTWK